MTTGRCWLGPIELTAGFVSLGYGIKTMNRLNFLLCQTCLLWLLAPVVAGQEEVPYRTLVSNDGKSIKAQLVSHAQGKVTIRREDGQEFEVDPAIFCKQDHEAILKWMEEQPVKIDYRLRAGANKKAAGSTEYSARWYYELTLRNDGQEAVKDIRVLYRILYENHGRKKMQEGEHLLEQELEFNRTLVIKSETIRFSRSKSNRNSGIQGCLIRVLNSQGEVILDWVSNELGMKDVSWETTEPKESGGPGPEVEIR